MRCPPDPGRGPRVGENKLRLTATCPSPGSRRLQGRSSRVAASPVHSHRYGPRCASRRPGAPDGLGLGIGYRGSPSASSSSLGCQSPPPRCPSSGFASWALAGYGERMGRML